MYADKEAFAADLQRVWRNCYLYNGTDPARDVVRMSRELETLAHTLMAAIPERIQRLKKVKQDKDSDEVTNLKKEVREMRKMQKEMLEMNATFAKQQMQMQMQGAGGTRKGMVGMRMGIGGGA